MWRKRREEGLKVTDPWHEYILSVKTILTLTVKLLVSHTEYLQLLMN